VKIFLKYYYGEIFLKILTPIFGKIKKILAPIFCENILKNLTPTPGKRDGGDANASGRNETRPNVFRRE
jgi:hypothetical protein